MWWSRRCCCKGQDFDWSHSLDDGSVLPCACLPCACLGPLPKRLWPPLPFIQLGHVIPTDGPALESIRRFRRSLHARFHSRRLFAAACFNAITIRGLGRACKRPVDHDINACSGRLPVLQTSSPALLTCDSVLNHRVQLRASLDTTRRMFFEACLPTVVAYEVVLLLAWTDDCQLPWYTERVLRRRTGSCPVFQFCRP